MTVSGKNKIELDDILIGDVWIGSGQSNMEMGIAVVREGQGGDRRRQLPEDPPAAGAEGAGSGQPAKDVKAEWVECSPKTVAAGGWGGFSAVLYYFGQRLHKELDVPVGLIDSSWGGSPIEPWTVSGKNGGGMYNGMIAPVKPLGHPRRDLVSGRSERRQRPEVLRQDEGPDRGLAEGLGLRFPLLLRPDRALCRATGRAACRRSGKPRWPASRFPAPAWP